MAQRDYKERGLIPIVDQGQELIGGYTDDVDLVFAGQSPVIVFGDHTRRIKLVDFAFAVGAQGVKLLQPKTGVSLRFAYWMLQSLRLEDRGYGRHFALLRKEQFAVPPLDEQRRIVDILEDHLSRLDAAQSNLRLARSRSERLVVAALLGNAHLQVAPTEPLVRLLTESLANGRSVPTREGGFPVLRLTALKAEGVDLAERKGGDWTESDAQRYLVKRGDFFVSRGNGSLRLVGRGAHVVQDPDQVAYPDTLIRIRTRSEVMVPEYLRLVWNSPIVRRQLESMARTTAGIYKINQKHLESVRIPVPGMEQQRAVSTFIGHVSGAASQLRHEIRSATQRAERLRLALLTAAFSGRLTGRASDLDVAEELTAAGSLVSVRT